MTLEVRTATHAAEAGLCRNGRCKRPAYRGTSDCFRCWAGTKWTSIIQRRQNANGRCRSYIGTPLGFTREEFILWVMHNPPSEMLKRPSLDRIEARLGYVPGNIRWIEWEINSRGPCRDLPVDCKRCARCKSIHLATPEFFPRSRRSRAGVGTYCRPCDRRIKTEAAKRRRGLECKTYA